MTSINDRTSSRSTTRDHSNGRTSRSTSTSSSHSSLSRELQEKGEEKQKKVEDAALSKQEALERRKELHRIRNRESMRKNRLKNKGKLDRLRESVHQLEEEYTQLLHHPTTNIGSYQALDMVAKYHHVMEQVSGLRDENRDLKKSLLERIKLLHDIYRIADSFKEEVDLYALDLIRSLTPTRIEKILKECLQQVQRIQVEVDKSVSTGVNLFGWKDRRLVSGDAVIFYFTKRFPFLTKDKLTQRTWRMYSQFQNLKRIHDRVLSAETVYEFDAHTTLNAHEECHPEDPTLSCRLFTLRFRIQLTDGFLVGRNTVEIQDLHSNSFLQSTNILHCFEITECKEGGCQVTVCGRRRYIGVKDVALVGYATFIEVLRWEAQTIGPIPLLPSNFEIFSVSH